VIDSLKKIVGYDGFAKDTLTNETDTKTNSLSGEPQFEVSKAVTRGVRALSVSDLIEQGEYVVNISVSDIISKNYALEDGQTTLKISDSQLIFTTEPRDGTPISKVQNPDKKHGVLLKNSIVSDKAEILSIGLPDGDNVVSAKIVIYDNVGNVVFETAAGKDGKATWDLHNSAGRSVANGWYLIVAEAKGTKGTYAYSTKVGVRK
jgi:hypothetical protein